MVKITLVVLVIAAAIAANSAQDYDDDPLGDWNPEDKPYSRYLVSLVDYAGAKFDVLVGEIDGLWTKQVGYGATQYRASVIQDDETHCTIEFTMLVIPQAKPDVNRFFCVK